MNSSAYVFGRLESDYTQYPDDYARGIFEKFLAMADAPSQIIIHRDKNIMYYGYVRRLSKQEQSVGMCVLVNGVMFSKIATLFSLFEKAIADMVSQGELIKLEDNGDIIAVAKQMNEQLQEVERVITYLREEVARLELSALELPPISYAVSIDSHKVFSYTDSAQNIVAASCKYGYVCIRKDEGFDTPLLVGLKSFFKRKSEVDSSPSRVDHVKEVRSNNIKGVAVLAGISIVFFIGGIFSILMGTKSCSKIGFSEEESLAVDSIVPVDTSLHEEDIEVEQYEDTKSDQDLYLRLHGFIAGSPFEFELNGANGWYNDTDSENSKRFLRMISYTPSDGRCVLDIYLHGEYIGKLDGYIHLYPKSYKGNYYPKSTDTVYDFNLQE